ncbi:uncharacterized protein Z520_09656 [Fonsecaea multimorphosa CBS 102226]|uniref:Phosphatidylethanolamine-binding protein n=1 Tax=Fonsecaea multimorphosa CBS 102226 TaxID=1442371 RepID=A0A0D2GYI3_9EURO|nr:uncharacterized protein Z520_09656 [Fonsecaea multimorphosa CBS 102226]KIX94610.1 hypothetical protein Z520_09656 [Fonsecaea multimorphosa CBS 102226]
MRPTSSLVVAITGLLFANQGSTHPIDSDIQIPFTEPELRKPPSDGSYSFLSTIRDVLVDHDIIGDVLDDFEPSYYLDISYPKSHETVLLGNDIPVDSVSKRPIFTFHSINSPSSRGRGKKSIFTLVLTDPDAKSHDNPKWSEMCHWILTNLTTPIPEPPSLLHTVKAKPGEIEEYLPPGPPPKTGAHRYVFVLLEGETSALKPPADRKHWGYGKPRHGVRDWAKENDLTVVGANFFYAQNEKQ